MVIECKGCSRKFNLDENRLKPGGSKVRCTRCGAIFTAAPPVGESRPLDSQTGCEIPERPAAGAVEPEALRAGRSPRRVALSVPVSCISLDHEDRPLNFYIGLITTVGPAGLGLEVFCSGVPERVLVSFINLDNRDVQIRGRVVASETNGSGKTRLELALAGTHQEVADFTAQLVKSYHYAN